MFSLIITIISIALVTALALATIYYGGSAFRQVDRAPSERSKRTRRQSYESPWYSILGRLEPGLNEQTGLRAPFLMMPTPGTLLAH